LDREKQQLERQEKQLEADIKKAAAKGDVNTARTLAKQLVKLRGMKQKQVKAKAQVSAVSHQTQVCSQLGSILI
jgi:hypothetical protein